MVWRICVTAAMLLLAARPGVRDAGAISRSQARQEPSRTFHEVLPGAGGGFVRGGGLNAAGVVVRARALHLALHRRQRVHQRVVRPLSLFQRAIAVWGPKPGSTAR